MYLREQRVALADVGDSELGRVMLAEYIARKCKVALEHGPRMLDDLPAWARRIVEGYGARHKAGRAVVDRLLEVADVE